MTARRWRGDGAVLLRWTRGGAVSPVSSASWRGSFQTCARGEPGCEHGGVEKGENRGDSELTVGKDFWPARGRGGQTRGNWIFKGMLDGGWSGCGWSAIDARY
jgi:hypothetical protein